MRPALLVLLFSAISTNAFQINALRPPIQRVHSPRSLVLLAVEETSKDKMAPRAITNTDGIQPAAGPSFGTHLLLPLISYMTLGVLSVEATRLLGVHEWTTWALMAWTVGLPVARLLWLCSRVEGVAERMDGYPADEKLVKYAREAARAVGVPPPDAVIELDRQEPNAFAASNLFAASPTVAVTRGLREKLSPTELKAVLAHEMGHLRNRDVVRNMHIALATAGMAGVYEAGQILLDARERSGDSDSDGDGEGSLATIGLALVAAGLATQGLANLARLCASRDAEFKADRAAAAAFGADAMISALRKINNLAARQPADLRESAEGRALAFAMISDGESREVPEGEGWWRKATGAITRSMRTHPPLDERVAALEQAVEAGIVPASNPKTGPFDALFDLRP